MKTREECLAALREMPPIVAGQKFSVEDFCPEDALGIARLYFAVYGEMFPVDYVYDPEEMVRLNAQHEIHQVVGRAENGDVVGLYALFHNPPGRKIMEAGSWIVHPDYRNTTLSMRLARRIHLHPPEYLGLNIISGQSVCDHLITQKMGAHFNALSCAIEIESMPPRPEAHEGWSGGRISLLNQFSVLQDQPHTVFLPAQYADVLLDIYRTRELQREYAEDCPPLAAETVCTVQHMDGANLVKMTVDEVGLNVAERLLDVFGEKPAHYVDQLVVPMNRSGSSLAVEAARTLGFFFGGLLPLWYDSDGLLLQRVAGEPVWAGIQLHTPHAKELLGLIRKDWEVVGR